MIDNNGYQACLAQFNTINLDEMRPRGFLEKITKLSEEKHSKIKNKQGWKEVTACPVCASSKRKKEFSKFGVGIVCCEECSLRYGTMIPVNTGDLYSDSIYLPAAIESYQKNVSYRKERFGKERIALIARLIRNPEGKHIFDIGCGTGWFLEVAKEHGFEIHGQEFGKELARWTEDKLGIKIFNKPISEMPSGNNFDVITMFDLIEHVPDPLQLIVDCKRVLKKGGIILVFTPNFDSLSVHIMKEAHNIIVPAEHLMYFTKRSVEVMTERAGLNLVYFKTCGIDLGDLKSYYEWRGEDAAARVCKDMYDLVQPVVDNAGAGNHLRFSLQN